MTGRFVRSETVLWRQTFDRVIVLVPATGEMLTLKGTAVDLWDLLEEPAALEQVAAALGERSGVAPALIAADLTPVLIDLATRGALSKTGT